MIQKKKNIQFISAARVIGILLVVFGHSYPFEVSISTGLLILQRFIYCFHMPLFICISGYLAYKPYRTSGVDYIKKRAAKLLVPYFSLSLLAYVPKVLVQSFLNDSAEFSLGYLIKSELVPRNNVWGHFWYIPVIFFFGCFAVVLNRLFEKSKISVFIVLIISILVSFIPDITGWFALQDMKENLCYFVFGMFLAYIGFTDNFEIKVSLFIGLPIAVLLFSICNNEYTVVMIACAMILFVFGIGMFWNVKNNSVSRTIEKYSYTIYLLSWPVQAVTEVVFNKVLHMPVVIVMLGMFMGGIIVPLLCVFLINKIDKKISMRWLKLIVGM